jgi:hypothetical protein
MPSFTLLFDEAHVFPSKKRAEDFIDAMRRISEDDDGDWTAVPVPKARKRYTENGSANIIADSIRRVAAAGSKRLKPIDPLEYMSIAYFEHEEAAKVWRSLRGGWLFHVENTGAFFWFNLRYTPTHIMKHPVLKGLNGTLI